MVELNEFGQMIFLDRYALKDTEHKTLAEGDLVLAVRDRGSYQKEIGHILKILPDCYEVQFSDGSVHTFFHASELDKPLELDISETFTRVAKAVAEAEEDLNMRPVYQDQFFDIMNDGYFIPAGRILSGAGAPGGLTLYNCYVIPSPKDSRGGIIDTLKIMVEIMSRGGGVGINLSSLRPKGAYVKGVNGRSSGSVSWGELYSSTTGLIEQGGSRRGALMLVLEDWHPDLLEFINAKKDSKRLVNSNISVGLSNKFMEAVQEDGDWVFEFPDTTHELYSTWDGDLESYKGPKIVYGTVPAKQVWNAICQSAWESAEPGVWFKTMSNIYSATDEKLIGVNPCGEQPLPAWGVCNLGSINLSKFATSNTSSIELMVNWNELRRVICTAVRFLDNVIDVTPYHFGQNRDQQIKERRIGLNTMGLAELLIKCGLKYGSEESLEFVGRLYEFISREAHWASAILAAEKGPCEAKFNYDGYYPGGSEFADYVSMHGMRNATLLTQAPNGTIGTMMG